MNKKSLLRLFNLGILCFVLGLHGFSANAQTVRYVKSGGTGAGTTWADASGDLQATINASSANDQVWVAAGTYLPTVLPGNGTNNRDKAFLLKDNVKVYGGFATTGNPGWTDRNWTLYETILSGDLGTTGNTADNAYHVVLAAAAQPNTMSIDTILDGFTITGGNANGNGAYYITVNGVSISANDGGGLHLVYCNATLTNNKIISNAAAAHGGGAYMGGCNVVISHSAITQNTAMYGAGLREEGSSNLSLSYVKVNGNHAMYGGGGIRVNYSTLIVVNSVISGNAAFTTTGSTSAGAGIYADEEAITSLTNVTISGNKCGGYGGGIYNSNATLTVQNTLVYANSSGIYNNLFGDENSFNYSNSFIQLVHDPSAGVMLYNNGNPLLVDAPSYTTAPFTGGDYSIDSSCSPLINAGSNSFLPLGINTDFAGNVRIFSEEVVDIGAYEFQAPIFNLPPVTQNQTFDYGATVASLQATGTDLKWYAAATGGEPLAGNILLESATYYVTQTIEGCESVRVPAEITIITYPVRYVKAGGTGNGTSWATASGNIQEMIDEPLTEEVWVAEGTYLPTFIAGNGIYDMDKTFLLKSGVKLYGGFPSTGTPAMDDRDWTTHETILSGDLGVAGDNTDNAFHVVVIVSEQDEEPQQTILDGFTITDGNANSDDNETLVFVNNIFIDRESGGAVCIMEHASAGLANLTISNNNAYVGGGIFTNFQSEVSISQTNISSNGALAYGGGIYNQGTLNLDYVNVVNNTSSFAAGIYNVGSPQAIFNNITVSSNISYSNGAGIYNESTDFMLKNSVISGNESTNSSGGGIYNYESSGEIVNVQITGNRAAAAAGGMYNLNGLINLTNVTISGNAITYGMLGVEPSGGMFNHNSDVITANSVIYGNEGGVVNFVSNPTYSNSLVQGVNNTANANIGGNINPLFTDMPSYEAAPFTGGNFGLQSNSPVINAGNNTLYTNVEGNTLTDNGPDANPRFNEDIDMGAYEYQGEVNCQYTTIWNGTSWSNGVPGSYGYSAIIDGDFTSQANITACSLYIYSGSTTLQTGHTFSIKGEIVVAGNAAFTVQNNAAIVQVDNVTNTGNIIYQRSSAALGINKATLWSSPVNGQPLDDFSPATQADGFKEYLGTGAFTAVVNTEADFNPGKGCLISMPQAIDGVNAAAYQAGTYSFAYNGIFTGVPNNGNISALLNNTGNFYTAIGNPYPSPLSIVDFFDAGAGILDPSSAIYLWSEEGGATGYSAVTTTSFVSNNPGSASAPVFTGNPETWNLSPGQGFIVQSGNQASQFTFANSMRRSATASQAFFRTLDEPGLARLWISLTAPNQTSTQASIAYSEFGTVGIDAGMDGKVPPFSGNNKLYSIADDTELAIQTRGSFVSSDVVNLGYTATEGGQYLISLNNFDGMLAEAGQGIYIKDLALNGLEINLKQGDYLFSTEAGTFESRFEIVFTGTTNIDEAHYDNTVLVYKNGDILNIDAGQAVLNKVVLYDLTGRVIHQEDALGDSNTSIKLAEVTGRILLAEIYTNQGRVTKKVYF